MGKRGLEHTPNSPKNTHNPELGGAESGADCTNPLTPGADSNLARLIEAWPTLPEPIRAGIVAMIDASAAR